MKKFALAVTALFTGLVLYAAGPAIYDIDIKVQLGKDGSARISEVWDINFTEGTEWYLVKENLGDISISDFVVKDESGCVFENIGKWNVSASMEAKAGRCGIVSKSDGAELCWGAGSYGHHIFTAEYTMTNVVKSLNDYDMLHMQFVSPGLSSKPQHVRVTVSAPEALSGVNSRIWGFGYNGTMTFAGDGTATAESDESFSRNSSVIALIRFDKGIFSSASVQDRYFEEVLDRALEGSSFDDEEEEESTLNTLLSVFLSIVAPVLVIFGIAVTANSVNRKRVLGCKVKDIDWCRDIPFDGDILKADFVRDSLNAANRETIASAMILRMVYEGIIIINKDTKENVELSFNDNADFREASDGEKELYTMMKEASGSDMILQRKEFSRWSSRHSSRINKWVTGVKAEAKSRMSTGSYLLGSRFTQSGQEEARKVIGFEKFLKDFTLIGERSSRDVTLWKEYLVFGALFGIAEKVAEELKEINPKAFEETIFYDYNTMNQVLWLTRHMGADITDARIKETSGSSKAGFGGGSSFGGGGGFSGGGFGGGAR